DDDLRVQIFLVFDDDHRFLLRLLIDFLLHGDTFDDVVEFHLARFLRENRDVVRIPLHEGFSLLDLLAVRHGNDRADDHGVVFQFAAVLGEQRNAAVFVEDNVVAVFELHHAQVAVFDHAVKLGLDLRDFELRGRRATDVERAHGELRAGFADRLRGDDAGGFAELDEVAGREIAAVAIHADAVFAFAREHGTDFDFLHAAGVNRLGFDF